MREAKAFRRSSANSRLTQPRGRNLA
jgi:hypothetical protein